MDSLFQFLNKLFDRVQSLLGGNLQRLAVSVDVNIPQRLWPYVSYVYCSFHIGCFYLYAKIHILFEPTKTFSRPPLPIKLPFLKKSTVLTTN